LGVGFVSQAVARVALIRIVSQSLGRSSKALPLFVLLYSQTTVWSILRQRSVSVIMADILSYTLVRFSSLSHSQTTATEVCVFQISWGKIFHGRQIAQALTFGGLDG
jgi:hypothetical protein